MKPTRIVIVSLFAGMMLVAARAQTIQLVTVSRQANFVQTGSATVVADPTTPFVFKASVEGDSLTTGSSPLTAATYTPPGGSSTGLTFNSGNHNWQFEDQTQTSMANLNALYTTGSYGFNLTGTPSGPSSVTVGSFVNSPLTMPTLTLSGGSWVGSSYVITNTATLTIGMNAVYTSLVSGNGYTSSSPFHYDASIIGGSIPNGPNGFINYDPTTSSAAANVSTPPNYVVSSIAAGSYTIEVSYDDVQNFATPYVSVNSASLYETRTTLSLTVIPESSTYAAILGAVALAGVALQRRRRQTA